MFQRILYRLFLGFLILAFTSVSLLSYLLEIRLDGEGFRIGKISFEPYFTVENVALSYEKDSLFVDIETAYIQKRVLDFLEPQRRFEKIGFSIKNGYLKGEETIGFSLLYPPKMPLEIIVEETLRLHIAENQQIELGFQRLLLKDLKKWVKEFTYHPSFDWLSTGVIDGWIRLDLLAKKVIDSQLILENIHGGNQISGSEIFIERIRLLADQKMDVLNGSMRFVEPNEGYDFGIENLAGVFRWTQDNGVFFNLDGLLRQGEDTYPIFLEGCRGEHTIFEADASLLLDRPRGALERIQDFRKAKNPSIDKEMSLEPLNIDSTGIKRYFHISLENPREGQVILKGLFDHVVESELHAFKQLFKPNILELDLIHVEELKAKFEIKGVWENGHLLSISAENMEGDARVSFYGQPAVPLAISGSYSDSKILQCQILDKTSRGIVDLHIQEGKIDISGAHLSSLLLNALLTPYRDGWVLKGVADVYGQIEKNCTKIHLSSSDLTFIDENVEFILTNHPLHADFLILEDQNVQGILKCENGNLQISGVVDAPLIFSNLSSRISIFNEEVYLDEITTYFKETQLQGRLQLKPISTGGRRLELEVDKAKGPLQNFSDWIHPIDPFLHGEVVLDSKGFRLQADLVEGGDLDYEIDLMVKGAQLGKKDSPYAIMDCAFSHSTWSQITRFDLSLMEESVDWLRFSGQIENQFISFDPDKNHLFQRPFKQIIGGKGEGGIALSLSKEDLDAVFILLGIDRFKNLEQFECFFGFKDFGNTLAATFKADQQEWNFIKEKEILTLKKGAVIYEGYTTLFEDIHLDLTSLQLSTPSIKLNGPETDLQLGIDKGNLTIDSGKFRGISFHSIDPSCCKFEGFCLKFAKGSYLIDKSHRFYLSDISIDLFSQNILLKSSKLEMDPPSWLMFKTPLSGWLKGEYNPKETFFELKMTPFSGMVFGQNIQMHQISGVFHKEAFNAQMEGMLDQLHFKTSFKTVKRGYERIKCSIDTDLGKAFVTIENHPEEGWRILESKGDLIGLIWSCAPGKKSIGKEKISLVGSWTLDPYLFENGLKTFKIPFKNQYKIEKPIRFNGTLDIFPEAEKKWAFKGNVTSKNMKVEGIFCRNLSFEVNYEEDQLNLSKIHLVDSAYELEVDHCDVLLNQREALLEGIRLLDFRPSAMKSVSGSKPDDPFMIKELVIPTLWMQYTDKLECKGKGELYFINREYRKKNLTDLPWDILGVLGLDPSLLVPICGHLEFSLDKDKIYFDRLKRSFSESHRSSFFLDPKNLSYIGLDGKLFVRLRMKQSVILKLTEPFMIAIDGDVANPIFKLK